MKKKPKRDLLIHHPTVDGAVMRVKEDGTIKTGTVHPPKEGEPIDGELVTLYDTPMSPAVHECETVFDPSEYGITKGPAKVTSAAYRANWDIIFGPSKDNSQLN